MSIAVFAACAAGVVASYAAYARDRASRVPAETFARKYTMPLRRPDVAKSLRYAPSGDIAADLVADATLRDVLVPVNLNDTPPNVRQAWLDAVGHYDEQMARAAQLEVEALGERPGWPYHAWLLGQLVFTRYGRALSPRLVSDFRSWSYPMYVAATNTVNDGSLWQSLALAYLQTWPDLRREHEKTSATVFRRAFEDAQFVGSTFGVATQTVGPQVIRDLSDRAKPLWAAFEQLAKSGDVVTAWSVHQRWDRAEWRERCEDLAKIERHVARGDVDDVRRLCYAWTSDHSVRDYDSAAAHRQAARLLEVWPAGTPGGWRDDPRAEIVRYFLAGRTSDVGGSVLSRATEALSGVPAPIRARVRVLAGDIAGAESIARSSDDFGSFEWTPYVLELARHWLEHGNKERARAALAQLPSGSAARCDARHVLALIDRATPPADDAPVDAVAGRSVYRCVQQRHQLIARFTVSRPVILDYGWDGARAASAILSEGQQSLVIPTPTQTGLRELSTRAYAKIWSPR